MLQALNHHVIGKPVIERKTVSGIVTSVNEEVLPMKMRVISVGADVKSGIKVGDMAIFPRYKDVQIKHRDEIFSIVHSDTIKVLES